MCTVTEVNKQHRFTITCACTKKQRQTNKQQKIYSKNTWVDLHRVWTKWVTAGWSQQLCSARPRPPNQVVQQQLRIHIRQWWWWLFPPLAGFGENVQPFISHLSFFLVLFDMEISSCTLIPLFMPRSLYSGSASWDDCGWVFPDTFLVSSSPDRFPHCA